MRRHPHSRRKSFPLHARLWSAARSRESVSPRYRQGILPRKTGLCGRLMPRPGTCENLFHLNDRGGDGGRLDANRLRWPRRSIHCITADRSVTPTCESLGCHFAQTTGRGILTSSDNNRLLDEARGGEAPSRRSWACFRSPELSPRQARDHLASCAHPAFAVQNMLHRRARKTATTWGRQR